MQFPHRRNSGGMGERKNSLKLKAENMAIMNKGGTGDHSWPRRKQQTVKDYNFTNMTNQSQQNVGKAGSGASEGTKMGMLNMRDISGMSRMGGMSQFGQSSIGHYSGMTSSNAQMSRLSVASDGSMLIENEQLKMIMEKKLHKERKNFQLQLKQLKPIVMQEAIDFIKRESEIITKLMTQMHHKVI